MNDIDPQNKNSTDQSSPPVEPPPTPPSQDGSFTISEDITTPSYSTNEPQKNATVPMMTVEPVTDSTNEANETSTPTSPPSTEDNNLLTPVQSLDPNNLSSQQKTNQGNLQESQQESFAPVLEATPSVSENNLNTSENTQSFDTMPKSSGEAQTPLSPLEQSGTPSQEAPLQTQEQPVQTPPVNQVSESTVFGNPSSVNTTTSPSEQQQTFVPQGLVEENQPPVTPPTAPSSSKPKRSGLIKWIVLLLVLILLGVVGFFVFQFGKGYVENNQDVTLQYWGLWENESIMKPVIDKFEADNPHIKIQYTQENITQYKDRLQSAIQRGDGPDIFRFHETWIPMLRDEIEPVPSDVVSPEEFTSSYYDVIQHDLLAGNTLWGIPYMIDGLGLYVNEDLFAASGVSVPKTYEDLLAVVPQLTVKNEDEIVTSAIALGTTNNVANFSDILGLMIMQNGGKLTNPTGQESEEAMVFYRKFATPGDPVYTWNELQDNSISAFANGRVAMIMAPSWRAFDIRQLNPNLRFHIEPVPQLSEVPVTWASYWAEGVSVASKHKKQAFEFLKYITSEDTVKLLYAEAGKQRLFGPPYAQKNLGSLIATDPFVGAYIEQAPYARSFPLASNTFDNGLNDEMIQYMENAINSVAAGSSPAESLSTMSQGFQQVLTKYGLATNQQSQ